MRINSLVIFFLPLVFVFQSCHNTTSDSQTIKEETSLEIDTLSEDSNHNKNIAIDIFQTNLANFISGKEKAYFDTIVDINNEFWSMFTDEINSDYIKLKNDRLDKMKEWSSNSFVSDDIDTSLVFYPFSGPDFLHANFLYPNANEYILLAREEIGSMPYKDERWLANEKETIDLLDRTYYFLRDVMLKSFFLTNNMKSKVREGDEVLSSLYWFLSRTDHQIVKVERVTIDENSNISLREDNEGIDGVRFHFIKEGESKVKKLTYFSCDISDGGFKEKNPNLLLYLQNMRSCNTYIKAASYLMHYSFFHEIRDVVLEKSLTIFQDDTGIPYKYVNNKNWSIRHFGSYVKPPSNFAEDYDILYQQDLIELYQNKDSEKLPFSLGYHWVSSRQNQMFIIRN